MDSAATGRHRKRFGVRKSNGVRSGGSEHTHTFERLGEEVTSGQLFGNLTLERRVRLDRIDIITQKKL